MKIEFKKPYNFEGQEHKEIEFDLDALTGKDLLKASHDAKTVMKDISPVAEMSKAYQAAIAAIACKQPVEFIEGMPAAEFTKVTLAVGNFLLDTGLAE